MEPTRYLYTEWRYHNTGELDVDFDPIVNLAVEDDITSHDTCSNSFAEMRLQFTDRRVLRDQHTLRLDFFDPCQGRSWFIPGDVVKDVCQIMMRCRCVERFVHCPLLAS